MNYFIFKGINSNSFSGLVVNTLPPITKAPKRVETQEIDGVDGEIITELGYSAYDKEIVITLLKHDKIDEIMAWLSGEGELVTSLEPNKFYKCRIIDEIDYERLYNMKSATITFRTQPFKYLYRETYQKFENPVGNIYVLNEGLEISKPLIKIKGSGTVEVSVEDREKFSYTFPEGETEVTIDSEKQDAYLGTVLKNRNMIGEFPTFKSGKNKITLTGNITEIYIIANSRWI